MSRFTRSLAALAVVAAGSTGVVTAGSAGPAAAANPDTIVLDDLDMVPERTWGVSGQDPSRTQTQTIDNLVWDFAQIGDRLFVGGAFLNVQESKTSDPIVQSYVAAFDVDSGDWISTWTPELDRAVYTLEVAPGGDALLVGGEFETVNGQTRRGLVALDPITGAIDPRFAGAVDRPWSELRAMVRQIRVVGDDIYIGGNFSHMEGAGGSRTRAYKAGRFSNAAGTIDNGWKPMVTGSGIWGLDVDPARHEVSFAGYFTAVNGEEATGYFHTVDDATGATVPGKLDMPRNLPNDQPEMFDVSHGDGVVFAIGEQHVIQVLAAADQQMLGYHTTGLVNDDFAPSGYFAGGAFQVGERIGDVVFAGCHCTYSTRNGYVSHYSSFDRQRTPHRLIMAYDASTGELIDRFMPDIHSPRDGTWAVGSDTNGCLYIGGDFHVGGVDHGVPRWIGGFAKLCPAADGGDGGGGEAGGALIEARSDWRYQDGGQPSAGWTKPGFDDSAWPVGSAELGFGDGDEQTTLTKGSIAYYARTRFSFDGAMPASLDVRLKADDGVVLYLNGTEILRDNLPAGPIGPTTPAQGWRSGADEDFFGHTVPAAALVDGENVLAVEIHNVWSGNNDLGFDLRLATSDVQVEVAPTPLVELGSTWRHADSSAGSAPAGWPADLPAGAAGPDPAELGFGEGAEATVLTGGQETYYFARTFEVDDPAGLDQLTLSLLADDGAVVYLNGSQVLRANMPAAGPIAWNTRPLGWVSGQAEALVEHTVPADALVAGTNTVTVEVHNFWPGNPDLSFDLGLEPAG